MEGLVRDGKVLLFSSISMADLSPSFITHKAVNTIQSWALTAALQYIKAMRLFKDEPKWTPLNRGEATDQNEFRQQYISQRQKGFEEAAAA